MNLDALAISVLKKELANFLVGARVDKIYQLGKLSICLHLYNKINKYLVIDMVKSVCYILDTPPQHMETPTAFCMFLRKHLEGGRITELEQYRNDRILMLTVDSIGFANTIVGKTLYMELTGKNSNLILVDDGIVLQALKHIGIRDNSFRQIQPNRAYVLPPQKEKPFSVLNGTVDILELPETALDKYLLQNIDGIGSIIAKELAYRTNLANLQAGAKLEVLRQEIKTWAESVQHTECLYAYAKAGKFVALSTLPLKSMNEPEVVVRECRTVNDAILYFNTLQPTQTPTKAGYEKVLQQEIAKQENKIIALEQDYINAEDAQQYKSLADNLMAYLYAIPEKISEYSCVDVYSGADLKIKMSERLTPVQNANNYYRLYNKAKRAITSIDEQLTKTREHLQYLYTLLTGVSNATEELDLQDVALELQEIGLLKKPQKKAKQVALSAPLHIKIDADTTFYIGKNNRQNDQVTFKLGNTSDMWLHIQKQPGAHVIIKSKGGCSEKDILLAAEFAAYFSKARYSQNIAVDYTLRKYVHKPSGSKPGFVIYERQNTVYVTPNLELIEGYINRKNTNDKKNK